MSFLKRIFQQPDNPSVPQEASQPESDNDALLALKTEVQRLLMEIKSRDETIDRLAAELERQRSRHNESVEELSTTQTESIMSDLSSPVSQLLTQADLLENQSRPVPAQDIMTIAKRLIRVLERRGMEFIGTPMQRVAFDPSLHQAIHAGVTLQPGQETTIRFVGVKYGSKMLLKALVD